MSKKKERLSTSGGERLDHNPFGALSLDGLKPAPPPRPGSVPQPAGAEKKSRGRLDVKREKSGRGGKTVTVVYGMENIERREREQLLKQMKNSCGVGGTMKGAILEVQGDNREEVRGILENAGFRVVLAGG